MVKLDSASDSDLPPPKSHRPHACMDNIASLFRSSNESEDEDDNWDLLDNIEDRKDDDVMSLKVGTLAMLCYANQDLSQKIGEAIHWALKRGGLLSSTFFASKT